MKYTLHKEPHYETESSIALTAVYQQDGPAQAIESICAKNEGDLPRETLIELLGPSARLMECIESRVDISGSMADFLLCKREDTEPYIKFFHAYNGLKKAGIDDKAASICASAQIQYEEPLTFGMDHQALFRWIENRPLSDQTKYDLVRLYYDFDRYYDYTVQCFEAATQVMKDELGLFEALIKQQTDYLQQKLAQQGIEFIHEKLHIKIEEKEHYDIYPGIALPNGANFYMREETAEYIISIGVGLFPLLDFYSEKEKQGRDFTSFLKALADPTKLNILLALRKGSLYASELAVALDLTGATISHHMNVLLNQGLVNLEKEGNRVYYNLRPDKIHEMLHELDSVLTKEMV